MMRKRPVSAGVNDPGVEIAAAVVVFGDLLAAGVEELEDSGPGRTGTFRRSMSISSRPEQDIVGLEAPGRGPHVREFLRNCLTRGFAASTFFEQVAPSPGVQSPMSGGMVAFRVLCLVVLLAGSEWGLAGAG